jgi:transposase
MLKVDTCGVDVGSKELVVTLRREGQSDLLRKKFLNTEPGRRALCRCLVKPGRVVRVCLESTGNYGLDLAMDLDACQGVEVMVANPRAVRRFAQAMMARNKSDQIDADLLEQFAARMPFTRWQRPDPSTLELRGISRRIKTLTDACTMEKNRLHAAKASKTTPAIVRCDIQASILNHQKAIRGLTTQALKLVANNPALKKDFALLITATGIARKSAIELLGELAVLPKDMDPRQRVAHAGLDPRLESSGISVQKKPRITKAGNKYLRGALYMPALTARRHDPNLKAFGDHLKARGKQPMQVIVALMRKILVGISAMLKNQQPYDGKKLFRLP